MICRCTAYYSRRASTAVTAVSLQKLHLFFTAENQIIRGCFLQLPQKVSSARKRSFDLATDNSFETTAFTNRFYRSV